jgi:phosphatidylserine/phosphatidylglycerophosphate/cardiolipin synthase-like enzyme
MKFFLYLFFFCVSVLRMEETYSTIDSLILPSSSSSIKKTKDPFAHFVNEVSSAIGKTHFIIGPASYSLSSSPPSKSVSKPVVKKQETVRRWHGKKGKIVQAFFSSDDNLQELLIDLINQEKKKIRIAVFSFTNLAIAQALVRAKERGVQIVIIVDSAVARDSYNKLELLKKAGIEIRIYTPHKGRGMMVDKLHHKFVLFDGTINNSAVVWTGSFNFTKAATFYNKENVVVLNKPRIINKFNNQFKQLYSESQPWKG